MPPVSNAPHSSSLDHLGAIVRDLAAGAARWEKLGFALSPLSRQSGRMPGRDDEGPWATANRCAIFQQGYLELIGVVDPASFNPWTRFLGRFEGLHLLALRVPNADAAFAALSSRTDTLNAPVQRARKLDVNGKEELMRFRNIFSRDEAYPEGRYIILEHQTPEYLWQPRYQTHPNGAVALEAALVFAENVEEQSARLETLIGQPPVRGNDGVMRFSPAGGGSLEIHSSAGFASRFGWAPSAAPCFAGAAVRFAHRERAARRMEDNGIPVQKQGEDWFVLPEHTNGFILRLT
jgi:hypothetical protein